MVRNPAVCTKLKKIISQNLRGNAGVFFAYGREKFGSKRACMQMEQGGFWSVTILIITELIF